MFSFLPGTAGTYIILDDHVFCLRKVDHDQYLLYMFLKWYLLPVP